jgi:hypothetical protein
MGSRMEEAMVAREPMIPQTSRKSSRRKSETTRAPEHRAAKTLFWKALMVPAGESRGGRSEAAGATGPKVVTTMSVMVTTMRGQVAWSGDEGAEERKRDLDVEDEAQGCQHGKQPGGGQGVALQISPDVESDWRIGESRRGSEGGRRTRDHGGGAIVEVAEGDDGAVEREDHRGDCGDGGGHLLPPPH